MVLNCSVPPSVLDCSLLVMLEMSAGLLGAPSPTRQASALSYASLCRNHQGPQSPTLTRTECLLCVCCCCQRRKVKVCTPHKGLQPP